QGYEYVSLTAEPIDVHIAQLLPEPFARRLMALPIRQEGKDLIVAMADPSDILALDEITRATGLRVQPVFTTETDLEWALAQLFDDVSGKGNKAVSLDDAVEGPGVRRARRYHQHRVRGAGGDATAGQDQRDAGPGAAGHSAGPGADHQVADPRAARDDPRHRADWQREDDDPVLMPAHHQRFGAEHHYHRGPRRVLPGRHLADPGPIPRGGDVCHGLAQHSAAGSGYRHGRRDPRRRDGENLATSGVDRP